MDVHFLSRTYFSIEEYTQCTFDHVITAQGTK